MTFEKPIGLRILCIQYFLGSVSHKKQKAQQVLTGILPLQDEEEEDEDYEGDDYEDIAEIKEEEEELGEDGKFHDLNSLSSIDRDIVLNELPGDVQMKEEEGIKQEEEDDEDDDSQYNTHSGEDDSQQYNTKMTASTTRTQTIDVKYNI